MAISTLIGVILTIWPTTRWLGAIVIAVVLAYAVALIGRLYEYRRLTSKPHVDLQIHEAFIVPTGNAASCFLRVSLHNEIGPTINNPPTHAYSLQLIKNGKSYPATNPLDTEDYELGTFKKYEVYDDDGFKGEGKTLLAEETLYRISTKIGELFPGNRIFGWIGFAVHYLPSWETDKELSGESMEVVAFDEDDLPIEKLVEKYEYHQHTRDVEKLTLTVYDSYGQKWTKEVSVFNANGREIKRKTK